MGWIKKENSEKMEKKQSKCKNISFWIIGILLVIIAGLMAGVYFYLSSLINQTT